MSRDYVCPVWCVRLPEAATCVQVLASSAGLFKKINIKFKIFVCLAIVTVYLQRFWCPSQFLFFAFFLSISLSISLSLFIYLSLSLSLYLSLSLSLFLCLYLSVSLSVCLFVSLSLCLSVSVSVCLSLYLTLFLSLSLSLSPSLCHLLLCCPFVRDLHFLCVSEFTNLCFFHTSLLSYVVDGSDSLLIPTKEFINMSSN